MPNDSRPLWQKTAAVFDQRAAEYDSWYDDSLLFAIELAALQALESNLAAPRVEVGCGPGRFGAELGVVLGIDPARSALQLAAPRLGGVSQAVAEDLPLQPATIGTLFILFTLCFVAQPGRVLAQCRQALRPGGHLVVGLIPASGPWGRALAAKREAGHPFYQYARFYEVEDVERWLDAAGLQVVEVRSSLYQGPQDLAEVEASRPGWQDQAGFVVIVARRP